MVSGIKLRWQQGVTQPRPQARVLRQRMAHLEAQNRRLKARWMGGSSAERAGSRPKSSQKPGACRLWCSTI